MTNGNLPSDRLGLWKFRVYNLQHFFLASVVIIGFLVIFTIALFMGYYGSHKTYELLGKVTSTLGPIAGGVIGYYFGQSKRRRKNNGDPLHILEVRYANGDIGTNDYKERRRA